MTYEPTHVAPPGGLPAWTNPDGTGEPAATLGAGLDVQVLERRGDWAHIVCSNEWEAWVDGRRLVAHPDAAPEETAAPEPTPPPADAVTPSPVTPSPVAPTPSPVTPSPVTPSPSGTPPTRPAPGEQPRSFAPAAGSSAPAASSYATASRPSPSPTAETTAETTAAAAVAPAPAKRRGSLGLSGILALIGGGLVLVSTALAWVDLGLSENAFNTPVDYIWDKEAIREDAALLDIEVDTPAAFVMLAFGVVIVAAALVRRIRLLSLVGGLGATAAAGMYLYQAQSLASDLDDANIELSDIAGPGPFVAVVGGVLAIVAGIIALRQRK